MRRTHLLTTLALSALLAGCSGADRAPAIDEAAVHQELTERMAAARDVLLAGDAETFIAFWTSDARILEPGVDRSGEALHEYIRDFFATSRILSFDNQPYDRFLHGEVAYETGHYDEAVQIQEQEPMTIRNYYFLRWEKGTDGVWRFDRLVAGPREAPAEM